VEALRNPGYSTLNANRSEGAVENPRRRSLSSFSNIAKPSFALRSTDSFAPAELRAFTTNTQGSAKPPPWAKFWYAFGVLHNRPETISEVMRDPYQLTMIISVHRITLDNRYGDYLPGSSDAEHERLSDRPDASRRLRRGSSGDAGIGPGQRIAWEARRSRHATAAAARGSCVFEHCCALDRTSGSVVPQAHE